MTIENKRSPQSMRYGLDELLAGMLATTARESFSDDVQGLGGVFKALSQDHQMFAPFAASAGEADFSNALRTALQKLVDKKLLQHEPGRYCLSTENKSACVRSKRTLFNARDITQLEVAAQYFDANAGD